jgi:putative ABC transport system permease protein
VHTNGKDGRALARHLERTIGQRPDVAGVAALSFSLNRGYDVQAWEADGEERFAFVYNIEPDILDILDIDVIAGRAFDDRYVSDSTFGTIINEAFAAQIGFTPEEAIGQRIIGRGESPPFIVGVIPNINFRSLHEEVEPMIMTMDDDNGMYYNLVKMRGADLSGIIADLGEAWTGFAPDIPLEYTFLDEDVARTYENDQRWSRVASYAAAVAILIACMGLFGLAALTIARRTKEIGVRKVLGASVSNILVLVSRDYAKLVLVASVFAAPVAYLSLRRWLEGFAYHVEPSVWVFALAGLAVLAVALFTVAYHAIRAATGNPVEALRYE